MRFFKYSKIIYLLLFFSLFCLLDISISIAKASDIKSLKKQIEKNPNDYEAHFNLANILLGKSKFHEASNEYYFVIKNYDLIKLSPSSHFNTIQQFMGRVHMGLGFALDKMKRHKAALKELETAIRIDPNLKKHKMLGITIGAIYGDLGMKEKEIFIYQSIIENNPTFIEAYFNLIKIDQYEMFEGCSNLFSINPDTIVSDLTFERLNNKLESLNFLVEKIHYREISKFGGLFRCSTLPLNRI